MRERTPRREERIQWVLDRRQPDLTVIAENIHDVHNVTAMMRSCDAVGVLRIGLVYTIEEFPDIIHHGKKSSVGTRKWIERVPYPSIGECYASLRSAGFRILVSGLVEDAVPLHELDLTEKVAILFGNENRGASAEALAGADQVFTIPMVGMVQSLNVSVAAAVTLYEAYRQRSARGMYAESRMDPLESARLKETWMEM